MFDKIYKLSYILSVISVVTSFCLISLFGPEPYSVLLAGASIGFFFSGMLHHINFVSLKLLISNQVDIHFLNGKASHTQKRVVLELLSNDELTMAQKYISREILNK